MPISFIPYTAVYGPLSVPGCVFWLDAVDINGTGTNPTVGNITTWKDKISGITLTATSADTLVASSANGLPGVRWTYNAGNGYGFTGTINSSYAITSGPIMVCCVVNYNNQASFANWFLAVNTAQVYLRQYQGNYWLSGVSGTTFASGTQLITAIYNGASSAFFVNGTQLFTGNPSTTQWTGIISVGSYWDGTTNNSMWSGDINEMITVLSTTNQQKLEGYLAQKWGLTANLPPGHPGLSQTLYNGRVYQPQISLKPAPYANYYPLSVAGCQLWLDGADATTVTGTSPVTAWRDKSQNVSSTTSVVGSPALTTNAINGLPAILLNGSSSFTGPSTGSLNTLTVCIVGTQSNTCAINGGLVCLGRPTYDDWNDVGSLAIAEFTPVGSGLMLSTRNGVNSQTTNTGGTGSANGSTATPFIYIIVFDGTYTNTYLKGTIQSTANLTTMNGTFAYTNYVIGSRAGSTAATYWTGYIGEVIIYNAALTTNQRQSIEGYLAWKWGITLVNTHPYYSSAPIQYTRGAILGAPTLTGISFVQSNYIGMTLTGSSAGAVTNYQIPITVYRTTGTNSGSSVYLGTAIYSDYSNLYFLASDQVTKLPFYIESSTITATSALIWVSVPTIPASPSTVKVYLYWYLSGTYTSSQNGTSTFLLFDEFTGSASAAPNSSIWTLNVKGSGGTGALTGSGTVQLSPTNATISSVSILSVNTLPANNFCIHVRRQFSGIQYTDITFAQTNSVQDLDTGGQSSWWHTTLAQGYLVEKQNISGQDHLMIKGATNTGASDLTSLFGSTPVNTWELIDFSYTSSGLLTWAINGSTQASATNTTYLSGSKYLLISQGMYTGLSGYVTTVDYVFVRNYVSPEPSVTAWGALNTP
jgi:hypothetical protein